MLIFTILKVLAWIWGIAIIIVLVVDIVSLVSMKRKGYLINSRRYLTGTLKSLPMAPLIYFYVIDLVTSRIADYYRKLFDKID